MWRDVLADGRVWKLLPAIDRELADETRAAGCAACGGPRQNSSASTRVARVSVALARIAGGE
jgi:hypothetical protein